MVLLIVQHFILCGVKSGRHSEPIVGRRVQEQQLLIRNSWILRGCRPLRMTREGYGFFGRLTPPQNDDGGGQLIIFVKHKKNIWPHYPI